MTEDEAKTKWCPFARVYEFGNRESAITAGVGLMPINSNCIASQCMAWRWGAPPTGWLEHATAEQRKTYRPHGFCGLAGKP